MRNFKVYRRDWVKLTSNPNAHPLDVWAAQMTPIMTISAKTPEAALRIAKQKNVLHPIVGEAQ